MSPRRRRGGYAALTPLQAAALVEFDRVVNAASEADLPALIVPAILGPRYGGGLRLRGTSPRQLRALLDLHAGQEWVLGHDAEAARAYLGAEDLADDGE